MRIDADGIPYGRKAFLAIAGVVMLAVPFVMLALIAPCLWAQAPTAQSGSPAADRPAFDVASIKVDKSGPLRPSPARLTLHPGGRLTTNKERLRDLIEFAYQLSPYQWLHISGQPVWSSSEYFDIEAKAVGNPGADQMRLMLQSLLTDRFRLVMHSETKQLPLYALVMLKSGKVGSQLRAHKDDSKCIDRLIEPPPTIPNCGAFFGPVDGPSAYKVTMNQVARHLGYFVDRPVVDRTGLSGTFDLSLVFQLDPESSKSNPDGTIPSNPEGPPSLFTALQEQLGLKLKSTKGPVDLLVIDHVEEPSPN